MPVVNNIQIQPLPMVTKEGLQRVDLHYHARCPVHLYLTVYRGKNPVVNRIPTALNSGTGTVSLMLPAPEEGFDALWVLTDREGNPKAQTRVFWAPPRERTVYVMISSHTDIGLHNSQYIQRHNSALLLDQAKALCDETADREQCDQYRYTMEGTWFWNNYGPDRGKAAAQALIRDYLKPGKIGVCCGIAGNHFQAFGLEELCRSAYERRRLQEDWGLDSRTMAIIDVNGFPMSMIQPYAEAGVENIIFAPNHWNPLPSSVWKMDTEKEGMYLNPDAGGGGSRVDVRYDSELPMVFFWEDGSGHRLLVWASTQYGYGGASFGLFPNRKFVPETLSFMEARMAKHLPLMEEKYPYDVWLLCCYDDDSAPDLEVTDSIAAWNAKWAWPKLRTLGDPDEPFRILKEKHGHRIPVLKGDITGGWYQHPLSTPELLAQKFEADRLLPTAEKWSAVASVLDESYPYPATEFRRAWDHLLYNDEHSYGTSGYQGRRVYETWMQHRDWIGKAHTTARQENDAALKAIASRIATEEESIALFNPTGLPRRERVQTPEGTWAVADVPPFGYALVTRSSLLPCIRREEQSEKPPVIENRWYRVTFGDNGSITSLFDKELGRELLDTENRFHANEPVYTNDNHKTFLVPRAASFRVLQEGGQISVTAETEIPALGARILQTVTLPDHEKRIDMDNRLLHVRDMVNKNRYHRYLYYAFPFSVENCRRYCHLNGAVAEYAVDVTGHGTDVYMAVNEWCCAENGTFGTALMMLDSQLVEFDHIHPDKTDFANTGAGSQMFVYAANDWLQMHTPGGSHLDYRFRYSLTSYSGSYQNAGIPQAAQRYANPVQPVQLGKQSGSLPDSFHSFLRVPEDRRLIGLKRADNGDGLIARLYGPLSDVRIVPGFGRELSVGRVTVDERPMTGEPKSGSGFSTYRLGSGTLTLRERLPEQITETQGAPAPIGSVYTGLITEPLAAAGEHPGQLYLLWGANTEEDLSHYLLYRSEGSGFEADETTFLAEVLPEEYRVGRYVDTGLKDHTPYYYRVCAVNRRGQKSPLSREFCGITRECI